MSIFKEIAASLVFIIGFYAAWIIYVKLAHRDVHPDREGRITLRPGLVSIIMGLLFVALTCLFIFLTFSAVIGPMEDRIFFLVLGPPSIVLMGFGVIVVFWIRIRVSDQGVEHRSLDGWKSFSWERVRGIDNHAFYGPRIHIEDHRSLYFWPYGYGINEIASMFMKHNKPFDLE